MLLSLIDEGSYTDPPTSDGPSHDVTNMTSYYLQVKTQQIQFGLLKGMKHEGMKGLKGMKHINHILTITVLQLQKANNFFSGNSLD